MSLSHALLAQVSDRVPFQNRVEQIIARADKTTVRCELSAAERLGFALTRLELIEEDQGMQTFAQLERRAEQLCAKVTYLLEPLQPIELDRQLGSALLRSRVPRRRGDLLSYYEVLANTDHHMTVQRFCYDRAARKRRVVEFVLSPDQLEMLVDDLLLTAN